MKGGEWIVTYPSSCSVDSMLNYLPGNADADGWGTAVEAEFERWIADAAQADPWLQEHPPHVRWTIDIPPFEVPPDHPIIGDRAGGVGGGRPGRRRRRPRLVVRRGDLHALRRHARWSASARATSTTPTRSTSTSPSTTWCVRAGDRARRDALVRRER